MAPFITEEVPVLVRRRLREMQRPPPPRRLGNALRPTPTSWRRKRKRKRQHRHRPLSTCWHRGRRMLTEPRAFFELVLSPVPGRCMAGCHRTPTLDRVQPFGLLTSGVRCSVVASSVLSTRYRNHMNEKDNVNRTQVAQTPKWVINTEGVCCKRLQQCLGFSRFKRFTNKSVRGRSLRVGSACLGPSQTKQTPTT